MKGAEQDERPNQSTWRKREGSAGRRVSPVGQSKCLRRRHISREGRHMKHPERSRPRQPSFMGHAMSLAWRGAYRVVYCTRSSAHHGRSACDGGVHSVR